MASKRRGGAGEMIRKVEIYLLAGGASGLIAGPLVRAGMLVWKHFAFSDVNSPKGALLSQIVIVLFSAVDVQKITACLALSLVFMAIEPYLNKRSRHIFAALTWATFSMLIYLYQSLFRQIDIPIADFITLIPYGVTGILFVVFLDKLKNRYAVNLLPATVNEKDVYRERSLTKALLIVTQLVGVILIALWTGTLMFTPMLFDSGESVGTWVSFLLWMSIPIWLLLSFMVSWAKYSDNKYSAARFISASPMGVLVILVACYELVTFVYTVTR